MSTRSLHSEKHARRRGRSQPGVTRLRRYFTFRRVLLLICLVVAVIWGPSALRWGMKWQAGRELSARHPEQALKWLKAAQHLGGNDAEVEYLMARAYRKQGQNFKQFHNHLHRAEQLGFPRKQVELEEVLAFAQAGHMSYAEPLLSRLLIDHPSEGKEIFEVFVRGYVLLGQPSHAMLLLDFWMTEFPDDPQSYFLRGIINRKDGDRNRAAAADFLRAFELDRSFLAAAYELAMVRIDQEKLQDALTYLTLVENDEKFCTKAQVGRAKCLRLLGDIDSAKQVLRNISARGDERADVYFERGQLELHNKNYREAVAYLQRTYSLKPRDPLTRLVLGNALRLAGDSEAAEEHFRWAAERLTANERKESLLKRLSQQAGDVAARCEIGKIEMEFGKAEIGVLWLKSALNYDPDCQEARSILDRYYDSRRNEKKEFSE